MSSTFLDQNTVGFTASTQSSAAEGLIGLTVLQHPDLRRVGEVSALFSPGVGGRCALSRSEPDFCSPGRHSLRPLASPVLSRKPLLLHGRASARGLQLKIDANGSSTRAWVGGRPLIEPREISAEELACGVCIELSGAIVLLLHELPLPEPDAPAAEPGEAAACGDLGIFGESAGVRRVRADIRRVADLSSCVLVRGESGSGKELVARAIHAASLRRSGPYVSVNIAAIPPSVASSMLFGHTRGAFTGAAEASPGFFRNAHGGTLFLDEIGEAPAELQPTLLRAIREGEIQPVGEARTRQVDVRLVSATDANLEALTEQGRFSTPLLRRIEGYTIVIPPLRERRDDIARLLFRFLGEELRNLGEEAKLDEPPPTKKPWLPTEVLSLVMRYPFPGNVAELRTIAQQLAITNRGEARFTLSPRLSERLGPHAEPELLERLGFRSGAFPSHPPRSASSAAPPGDSRAGANLEQTAPLPELGRRAKRDPATLTDEEVVAAMRSHDFKVKLAALALGVSRSWLNARIEDCRGLRKANSLSSEEIQQAAARFGWKTLAMAEALEVSEHGLKLRVRALGLR